MDLFETNDTKSELLKRSAHQRNVLEEEMKQFTERTGKAVTNGLLIGGALLTGYLLVRVFSSSKEEVKPRKKKRKHKHTVQYASSPAPAPQEVDVEVSQPSVFVSLLSDIGTSVASQATALLLSLAKEKLMEFLAEQAEQKKQEDES